MYDREPDDEESCGCTMGHACPTHAAESARRRENERAAFRARGVDPDAEVVGDKLEIWMMVSMTDELSRRQKLAIERILFPLPGSTPHVSEAEKGWVHERRSAMDEALDTAFRGGIGHYTEPPRPKREKKAKAEAPKNVTFEDFINGLFGGRRG